MLILVHVVSVSFIRYVEDSWMKVIVAVWMCAHAILHHARKHESIRASMKRSQESFHRKLNSSSKNLKPAHIGNTVVIPISEPDKVNSLGPLLVALLIKMTLHKLLALLKAQSQLLILGISLSYFPVIVIAL